MCLFSQECVSQEQMGLFMNLSPDIDRVRSLLCYISEKLWMPHPWKCSRSGWTGL